MDQNLSKRRPESRGESAGYTEKPTEDPVTLERVAREAGVSISTVSLVLSGKGRISADTRTAVLDTVERLGYRKRRSPATGRPGSRVNIAVLINTDQTWSFLWNFERLILNALESVLVPRGYGTVLIPLTQKTSWETVLEKITSAGCAAVFPMHYGNQELFLHLGRIGLPVIPVFNNRFKDRLFTVGVDDVACAADAVNFLISLGHRRIAYLDCPMDELPSTASDRYTGYRQALAAAGLAEEKGAAGRGDDRKGGRGTGPGSGSLRVSAKREDFEGLGRGLASLFSGRPRPTALFVLDDDLAARAIAALGKMGISVPGDLSVIAAGDVLDYSLPHLPRITTMSIDLEFTGRIAGEMMLKSLAEGLPPRMIKIGYTLSRRGSCAPPRKSDRAPGVRGGRKTQPPASAGGPPPGEKTTENTRSKT